MTIREILDYHFMQRALIVGVMLAIVFALFGNIVVLRKGANIAHTISHFALLGIAWWLFFQINGYISMVVVLLVGIGIIHLLQKRGFFSDDAINEILAQLGLVWSILFFSYTKGYLASVEQYLFGDILLITQLDMYIVAVFSTLVLIGFGLYLKPLLATSFNPKIARVYNLPVNLINFVYILLLSLAIGMSIKILWVLLVTAFIVLAPNVMKIVARTTRQMILWSIVLNIVAVFGGMIASYFLKIPSGIGIVAFLLVAFVMVSIFTKRGYSR